MLLELMSNGTLAKLPPENTPDGITLPDEPSVMVLLPHNKYLLGTGSDIKSPHWVYCSDRPGSEPKDVFLYDDEMLSLLNDGAEPTILSGRTVNALKKELFLQMNPPGNHVSTVLILRTFMKNNPAFTSDAVFQNEESFMKLMKNDKVLYKAYWALRFAMARGELEAVARLKAWIKAGPEIFEKPDCAMKLWFSILDSPGEEALEELGELNFSRDDISRMVRQKISPLVLFNPKSGWLVLGRFGRSESTMFFAWAYLNSVLWHEIRERKKLPIHELILALWGEADTEQAVIERARYKRGEDLE